MIDEDPEVGVAVNVDESRGDHEPGDVEDKRRSGRGQGTERFDPAVPHGDVGREGRSAGPVHDPAAAQHEVEGRTGLDPSGRPAAKGDLTGGDRAKLEEAAPIDPARGPRAVVSPGLAHRAAI